MGIGARNLGKQLLAVFLFVYIVSFAGSVFAASEITHFIFTTEPQTVQPAKRSGALTIQAQDVNDKEIKSIETIYLEFSSTSSTGEFVNASSSPVSAWVMSKGTANRSFYYRDSTPGLYMLTVKARGKESGTSWTTSQAITVSNDGSSSVLTPPTPFTPTVPSGQGVGAPTGSVGAAPPPSASAPAISSNAQISVDAGSDQTSTAGSLVEFRGIALGLKKEPLAPARFWWNFGDGETQEGKVIEHIFRIPGTYIVGLHVSSGEYSSSDYATVRVLENQMRVGRVVSGGEGYIQLVNPLKTEVDIGDWIIEDGSHKEFFIPPKTKIAAGGDLSLSNAVTGLLMAGVRNSLTIQYPNGTIALSYIEPETPNSPAGSIATSSQPAKIQNASAANLTAGASSPKSAVPQSQEASHPMDFAPDESAASQNIHNESHNPAAIAAGFSVSSRMMFAGAIGLSALGAIGFFFVKHFLIS